MSTFNLLPGFGGKADISLTTTADSAVKTSDVYDCSKCDKLAIQVKTWAAGNLSVQPKQSFDGGTNFNNLGTAVTAVGSTILLDPTDGPFGLVEVTALSSDTAAVVAITLTGFASQIDK